MSGEISETRASLNDLMPDNCDCAEIKLLANAYDANVRAGYLTHGQAVEGFQGMIQPDCQGKVPRDEVEMESSCFADGCGVAEMVCKHSKYLIAMTMKVRNDTAT